MPSARRFGSLAAIYLSGVSLFPCPYATVASENSVFLQNQQDTIRLCHAGSKAAFPLLKTNRLLPEHSFIFAGRRLSWTL